MTRSTPLAPMIGPDAVAAGAAAVRSPKTAELVAGTLRRMVVDGQLKEAAERYAKALELNPNLIEAKSRLESLGCIAATG